MRPSRFMSIAVKLLPFPLLAVLNSPLDNRRSSLVSRRANAFWPHPLVRVDVSVAVDIEIVEAVVIRDLIVLPVPVSTPLRKDTHFVPRQPAIVIPVIVVKGARIATPFIATDHAVVVGIHPPEPHAIAVAVAVPVTRKALLC
jgi:hypothetical protein